MDAPLSTKVREDLELGSREGVDHNRPATLAAFEAGSERDPLDITVKIERAAELRALDRLDEAAALLDSVLISEPTNLRALIECGHLFRRRADHQHAATAFRVAAAVDPHNRNIQVELARDLRTLDRFDEADAILKNILDAEPHQTGALIERGLILRQRGKHEEAATAFKIAATSDPSNRSIEVEFARSLRAANRLDEAENVLGSILATEPRHFGALIERGHLLLSRGDRTGALATFEAAATIQPEHIGLQMEIANVFRSLGRLSDAEGVLRRLTSPEQNNLPAIITLSHLLMDANRLDEAATYLNQAFQKYPTDPHIAAALGHLVHRRGDGAAALQYFISANERDPSNLDLRLDLAAEMREQGDFDGAQRLIQSVLDADANHWGGWMHLGQLYRAKRDPKAAMNAFETAVATQPLKPQGLVELAHETWAAGRPKEAERLLQKALATQPDHPGALLASAEFAFQSERPEEALKLAQRAIRFHPGKLGAYLLAARAAGQVLEREQALNILEQARKIFGPLPELIAVHVHVVRHFRDFDTARSLIASSRELIASNFSLWLESTSFAISVGEFKVAENALTLAPAKSKSELAHVHLLRAQIAEGRRQYVQAIAYYQEALALDPNNSNCHGALARAFLLRADISSARPHLRAAFESDKAKRISAGHTFNISQNHTGQLINEFLLVPGVLTTLKQIVALPDEQQIEPLKRLVRDNPEHTAPAFFLMLAMRNSAAFSSFQTKPTPITAQKIPPRIVQYWHSKIVPHDVKALMRSWSDVHNDYQHIVFNDETADNFLRANFRDEICRTFHRAQEPGQRADILRLAYLSSKGGYFIDSDDKCLARLDTFVSAQAEFAGYQDHYAAIGTNFIGAVPGHPVIALALENAVKAGNRGDRDIVWLSTGPGLLTRAFTQVLSVAEADWLNKVHLLELWELQRAVGIYFPTHYKRPHFVKTNISREMTTLSSRAKEGVRPTIAKIEVSRT